METARDYAGAFIRRVLPMYPCARVTLLSEYSACFHFLCSIVPPEPQVTISPCVPINPELLLPLTPHRPPRGSAPSAVVPVPVSTARPVPTLANQRPRAQQPEIPPEKGYRCPVGRSRGAWESTKQVTVVNAGVASFCCNSYRR